MKVLIIEDNSDHFFLIEDALSQAPFDNLSVHHEKRLEPGLEALYRERFDVCLCDLQLPDAPINITVERLKCLNTETPIIVLTSLNSTDIAKDLLQEGIQDYLPKDELSPTLLHRMSMYAIERKNQQLLLEKENADMQTFCASLSHDFKGHLRRITTVIKWIQEAVGKRIDLSTEELEWFHYIDQSTTGIRELVDSLGHFLSSDYVNIESERVALSTLFLQLKHSVMEISDKDIEINIQSGLPFIEGNVSQLTIMFHNLIVNAVKYNESIPRIDITYEIDKPQKYCKIKISDNGIGIDEKHFDSIFRPFERLHGPDKYSGSGLGLSIVKRIVEQHHGKISVESAPKQGSIFVISLPLATSKANKNYA
ncbi:MAG: hypothetical protein COA42_04820 [Alteromonadaceae bacterium]|nr:MAG: hypothetical protein COA42_04820 [Alteromonadaceae bacterium]